MRSTFHLLGKTVEIPHHMRSISQDFIDQVSELPDRSMRIISCGVDPRDSSLCILTGDLRVRTIVPNGTMVPIDAAPEFDGIHISVLFLNQEEHRLRSESVIKMSSGCMEDAQILTSNSSLGTLVLVNDTYSDHDDKIESPEENDS